MRLALLPLAAAFPLLLCTVSCRKASPAPPGGVIATAWPPVDRVILQRPSLTISVDLPATVAGAHLDVDGRVHPAQARVRGARATFVSVDLSGGRRVRVIAGTPAAPGAILREYDVELVANDHTFAAGITPRAGLVGSTVTLALTQGAAAPNARAVLHDPQGDGQWVDLGSALTHALPLRAAGVSAPRICVVDANGAGHVVDLDARIAAFEVGAGAAERRTIDLPGGPALAAGWSASGLVAVTDRLVDLDLRSGGATASAAGVPTRASAVAGGLDGALYVASTSASGVARFVRTDGRWASDTAFGVGGVIGGRGAGPGRFLGALTLAVIQGGDGELVAVADSARRDVQLFDDRGRFIRVAAGGLAGVAHIAAVGSALLVATGHGRDRGLVAAGVEGERIAVDSLLGAVGDGGPVTWIGAAGQHVLLLAPDSGTVTIHRSGPVSPGLVRVLPIPSGTRPLAADQDVGERIRVLSADPRGLALDILYPEPPGYRPTDDLTASIAAARSGSLDLMRERLTGQAGADFDAGRDAAGFAAAASVLFAQFSEWRELERPAPDQATLIARHDPSGRWVRFLATLEPGSSRWLIAR